MTIAFLCLVACGPSAASSSASQTSTQQTPTQQTPTQQPDPVAKTDMQPPATECQEAKGEELMRDFETSMGAYGKLELLPLAADCEVARLYFVEMGRIATEFAASGKALSTWSHTLAEDCRERNRATYGPRMKQLRVDLEPVLTPIMDRLDSIVPACQAHPGFEEAVRGASMLKAKP